MSLARCLAAQGLQLRGGFVPGPADDVPSLPQGIPAAVVWLVAQAGSEIWPHFSASGFAEDGLPDPLDRWSQSIGDALALELGGLGLYPSGGPPFHPFQRWARRIEPLDTSPLLLQLHPEFGLWHAYRFALALPRLEADDAEGIRQQAAAPVPDLCARCVGQPCLRACPVEAFGGQAFAVDRCATHLQGAAADACNNGGCLARRACPVGAHHRYVPAHAAFHMEAFLRLC
jgi:hypothetical protein